MTDGSSQGIGGENGKGGAADFEVGRINGAGKRLGRDGEKEGGQRMRR